MNDSESMLEKIKDFPVQTPGTVQERREKLSRLLDSLTGLPDAATASAAACALVAGELADAGVVLTFRQPKNPRQSERILADYPAGIGLADIPGSETISTVIPHRHDAGGAVTLIAWRSRGDRRFSNEEQDILSHVAPKFAVLASRLIADQGRSRQGILDPETGVWSLPPFLQQAERRFDRLDVEDSVGTMFAFGWVRCDGSVMSEASTVVVRNSVACLQEMLRPADLVARIGPTRIGVWCDGVDHLIAAERGDRILTRLDALLSGSSRHAAVGIASRRPQSGDDPATLLMRARTGLEQARLAAVTQGKPAVRIWQPPDH